MDAARWDRIKSVFQETFDRDPAERAAFLDAACGDDGDLRAAVERLLDGYANADGFLDARLGSERDGAGVLGERDRSAESLALPEAPVRIGNYRVIRELGRGGMGAVYLAERDDPTLRKMVAIKIVERDSHFMLRRFRTETQILAALEHPGIARLYDGGTTDEGLPYFVMEYVAGETILAYCDAHHLPIPERLQLFRRVCEAVQFAHQSFIVHRDLKPSNILVTADGEPKLLDFGIAKLLNPELTGTGQPEETIEVARLLTPQYASPEHVRGQPVTTASDVYSLGVILYELLCGVRPYRITGQQSTAEIERAVCETDPPAPSSASPAKRRGTLRGDLDNIVLKALHKEPAQRYGTAAELADDVRRHLEGFPVLARPDRLAYRAGKFVRRHRGGVAAAVVASLALIVGLAVALWQGRVARLERDHARTEAAKARQITTFLSGIFQGANPVQARGKTVTARDLLDRATASIATELKDEQDVQASLLLVMAEAYSQLAIYDKGVELAQQSLALRERLFNAESVEVAEAQFEVGYMERRIGRPARALPYFERALATQEKLLGPNDRAVALTLSSLALAREAVGQTAGTRDMVERAIKIEERAAPASARLGSYYNNLATLLHTRGDVLHARTAYEHSIAAYEKSDEAGSWGIAMPLLNLGELLLQEEDLAPAQPLLEHALAVDEATFGKESSSTAYTLARLGALVRARGDVARARELLERSLQIYTKVGLADHLGIADPARYLGQTLIDLGKPGEAIPSLERALRLNERSHGPDHPDVAEILVDLGRARAQADGPRSGEPLLRRALAIQRQALAADHPSIVQTLTTLGEILVQEQRAGEAQPLLEEAVRVARARLPERHSKRVAAEAALTRLQQYRRRSG